MGNTGNSAPKESKRDKPSREKGKGGGKGKGGSREDAEVVARVGCLPHAERPSAQAPPGAAKGTSKGHNHLAPASGDIDAAAEASIISDEGHAALPRDWGSSLAGSAQNPGAASWSRDDSAQKPSPWGEQLWGDHQWGEQPWGEQQWGDPSWCGQPWGVAPVGLRPPPPLPAPSLGLPAMPVSQAQQKAEEELRRKNEQIAAVVRQIEATQAELQQLRSQQQAAGDSARLQAAGAAAAAARIQQARELVASTSPELESMKENLSKILSVSKKLDAWFVENSGKMHIEDPTSTPSAFLHRLLESCDRRLDVLSTGVSRTMSGVEAQRHSMSQGMGTQPGNQQQQLHLQQQQITQQQQWQQQPQQQQQPLGSQGASMVAPTQLGGDAMAGMWVRDPDAH